MVPQTNVFANLLAFLLAYGADDDLLRRAIHAGADVDRTLRLMSGWTPDIVEQFGGENLALIYKRLITIKIAQTIQRERISDTVPNITLPYEAHH